MSQPRILITGLSAISAIGHNVEELAESLRANRIGRQLVPAYRFSTESSRYRSRYAATLPEDVWSRLGCVDHTMLSDFALLAAESALRDAGLYPVSVPMALCIGTSVGGAHALNAYLRAYLGMAGGCQSALMKPCTSSSIVGAVALGLGIEGPMSTQAAACSASAHAVGRAARLVASGEVDIALAGGADLFTELTYSGFNALKALSPGFCRPLDEERDGLMLGDGAAFVVLEDSDHAVRRSAHLYAELASWASANDPYHPTAPDPNGIGVVHTMTAALMRAGIDPCEVDYVNAHGTGTLANDAVELDAIAAVLAEADSVFVSSTKGATGHTLGAASALEAVIAILAISEGLVAGTATLITPLSCSRKLILNREPIDATINVAMSNSLAFGGNVATLVFRRP